MVKRKLGNRNIPAIGQGTIGLDSLDNSLAIRLIQQGIDLDMLLIDTADSYGEGMVEQIVGKAIRKIRDKVFLATKLSPDKHSYKCVIQAADDSLKRLQTDYIDLYQIHWPNPGIDIQETLSAMNKLTHQGKVKNIGVCNFSVEELQNVSHFDIISNQVEYNIYNRYVETSILPYCQKESIAIIAYSPLNKGRQSCNHKHITTVANHYDVSECQIMLSWLLSHQSIVIPRSSDLNHIYQNANSYIEISLDDINYLDKVFEKEIQFVKTDDICIECSGEGNTNIYRNINDAINNSFNFCPSPSSLSKQIESGIPIKPVILKKNKDRYTLIDGPLRYWAWVIALGRNAPISAYVMEE